MLFNCSHPANQALTVDLVNTVPGRDLHRFCWLDDAQVGALPVEWNWLEGHSVPMARPGDRAFHVRRAGHAWLRARELCRRVVHRRARAGIGCLVPRKLNR
jgi:hypothetical protein